MPARWRRKAWRLTRLYGAGTVYLVVICLIPGSKFVEIVQAALITISAVRAGNKTADLMFAREDISFLAGKAAAHESFATWVIDQAPPDIAAHFTVELAHMAQVVEEAMNEAGGDIRKFSKVMDAKGFTKAD